MKPYSMIFAMVTIVCLGVFMPGLQSNATCDTFQNSFGMSNIITVLTVAFFLAMVIFDGIKQLPKWRNTSRRLYRSDILLFAGYYYFQLPLDS